MLNNEIGMLTNRLNFFGINDGSDHRGFRFRNSFLFILKNCLFNYYQKSDLYIQNFGDNRAIKSVITLGYELACIIKENPRKTYRAINLAICKKIVCF